LDRARSRLERCQNLDLETRRGRNGDSLGRTKARVALHTRLVTAVRVSITSKLIGRTGEVPRRRKNYKRGAVENREEEGENREWFSLGIVRPAVITLTREVIALGGQPRA